jgi:hypothetical protein
MQPLPEATPEIAQTVWQSMRNPSTRRVATKLRQAGYSISHMRVSRWRRRGWVGPTRQHPLERAEELLNDAVSVLAGDVNTTARQYAQATSADQEQVGQLSNRELLERAARELAIISIQVSRSLQMQVDAIFEARKIAELAVLIKAFTACFKAIIAVRRLPE